VHGVCAELGEMVLEKMKGKEWGYGFNAKTLEFTDLIAAVRDLRIDPHHPWPHLLAHQPWPLRAEPHQL
jgi:hypothetical protein